MKPRDHYIPRPRHQSAESHHSHLSRNSPDGHQRRPPDPDRDKSVRKLGAPRHPARMNRSRLGLRARVRVLWPRLRGRALGGLGEFFAGLTMAYFLLPKIFQGHARLIQARFEHLARFREEHCFDHASYFRSSIFIVKTGQSDCELTSANQQHRPRLGVPRLR